MNEYIESNKPIKEKNEFLTKKNEIFKKTYL